VFSAGHYLASSAMRDLDAVFYVNDIHFQEISGAVCEQPVKFRADIDGDMSQVAGHLKWYIGGTEEIGVRDQIEWEKSFAGGVYQIKMEVLMDNGEVKIKETVITIEYPVLTQLGTFTFCAGDTVPDISFTGHDVNTVIWEVPNGMAIGMNLNSGTGNIPTFIAKNSGNVSDTVTVTVMPKSAGGCTGDAKTFIIVVNPSPMFAPPLQDIFLCTGETFPNISFTGSNILNVAWNAPDGMTIGMNPSSGTGNIPRFTAINNTNDPLSVNVTVTAVSATGCEVKNTFAITVNLSSVLDSIPDMILCAGDTSNPIIFIGSTSNITWIATGSGTSIGLPANSGTGNIPAFKAINNETVPASVEITVMLSATSFCEGLTKTFTITIHPLPILNPIQNIALCTGETVPEISVTGYNLFNVAWNAPDGMTIGMNPSGTGNIPAFRANNSANETQSVIITVTPTSAAGCEGETQTFSITVYNRESLETDLGNDTTICQLDKLLLDASHPNADTYEWQDSSTDATYIAYNKAGQYWVIVKSRCNQAGDTININHYRTLTVNLGKDMEFCPEDVIYRNFNVTTPGASSYLWQDSTTSPVYIIEEPGIYSVTVSNICMSVSDEIEITIKDCNVLEIWIPNAFSPNGDGLNDVFKPEINNLEYLKEYEMAIYDRWGKLIFITQDYLTGWNGKTHNGRDCSEGIYAVIVKYRDNEGRDFIRRTSVTLLR